MPDRSEIVSFFAPGIAETKGSWIAVAPGVMVPDNKREKGWATTVAWAAKVAMRSTRPTELRVVVEVLFHLPDPPNKTKKHRRDVDKLARSVLDAMTGIVYVDDEQVDKITIDKVVAPGLGAHVTVSIR